MAGSTLTTASTLQCPHGGQVKISSSNSRAKAGGSAIVTRSDTFSISGCSFALPSGPSPCVSVKWMVADMKVKAGGEVSLSQGSVGLCLSGAQVPQGPVVVANTQAKVSSR